MQKIKLYKAYNGSIYTKEEIVPIAFEGSPGANRDESIRQLALSDEEFDKLAVSEEWKVDTYEYEIGRMTNNVIIQHDNAKGILDVAGIPDDEIQETIIRYLQKDYINFYEE